MEGYINVREEPITEQELSRQIKHDYRLRKDLDNVDYSKNKFDIHGRKLADLNNTILAVEKKHNKLYKQKYKRSVDKTRTRSHKRGVITFPAKYQEYYEQGKFNDKELLNMLKDFTKEYEKLTGRQIYNYVLHSRSEKTLHFHYYATNYDKEGSSKRKKGEGSQLQDIAGKSFQSIGLRRGEKKEIPDKHKNSREHYNEILNQAYIVEEKLNSENLTAEEVQTMADYATKPLKTMLLYVKRALDLTADAKKIKTNQERAITKMREVFPEFEAEHFEELVNFIVENQTQLKTKNFTPKRR